MVTARALLNAGFERIVGAGEKDGTIRTGFLEHAIAQVLAGGGDDIGAGPVGAGVAGGGSAAIEGDFRAGGVGVAGTHSLGRHFGGGGEGGV